MKGLLLKDAYQIWHYAKGVIVATVVMMGAGVVTIMNGANFFIVYAGFLMGMMPMTLLAYDQASKFSEYSAALPVTKEQLVGSKYIVGLCGLVLAELFAAAALGVASLHWTAVDHALVVSTLVQVGMTTLLNSAVLLPLNYRFGYEKAKYAFYLMVGLVAALMGFGMSANEDGLARNLLPQGVPPLALLGIVLIVLGLYSLSWRLVVMLAALLAKARMPSSLSTVRVSSSSLQSLDRAAPKKVSPAPLVSPTLQGTPATWPVFSPKR